MKPQIEQPLDCKILFCMIYFSMSSEQVTKKSTQTFIIDNEDIELEAVPQKKKSTKVDINLLMTVREEKKEKRKFYF